MTQPDMADSIRVLPLATGFVSPSGSLLEVAAFSCS